jgi:hypothetical protein
VLSSGALASCGHDQEARCRAGLGGGTGGCPCALRGLRGRAWNDLEDACVGPVHWDVAGLILEARARPGSEAFAADFLRAYGELGLEELGDFLAARQIYTTVWQEFDAQRRQQR